MDDVPQGAAGAEEVASVEPTPSPVAGPIASPVTVAGPGGVDPGGQVCEVALEEFEGPLDLLLHLVRRHELDILDIPISFVCEKYLEYIEFVQALDLEVAGDYLVMAATLAYLKSRELVPQQEELIEEGSEEEGPDPRQQLILRLLEYQKFKDAAQRLDQRPIAGRDTFGRGQSVELPPLDAGLAPITLFRLAEAYSRVLERARIHKSHEVVMESISVAERMQQLTAVLIERARFEFEALFLERSWSSEAELRGMLVVTLMSVLELVRMGVASVHQPLGADTIVVERVADEHQAREALRGYDESLSFGDGRSSTPEPGVEASAGEVKASADVEASAEREAAVDVAPTLVADPGVSVATDASDPEPTSAAMVDPGDAGESVDEPVGRADEVYAQVTDHGERPTKAGPSAADGEPVEPVAPGAGAAGRSVVSESPSADPAGVDEAASRRLGIDGASESTEGDGQGHEQNGEAEALEGS